MAGKERTMKDKEYCVRFPLDFFDDARVKVIEAMPSGEHDHFACGYASSFSASGRWT